MYNATNRLIPAAALLIASSLLGGCSSAEKKERIQAEALLNEAKAELDNRNYESAMSLIDSLTSTYPRQVEMRKAAIPVRAKAMKEFSEQRLLETDSLISNLKVQLAQCDAATKHISGDEDIDGYYVSASVPRPNLSRNAGIEPRVSDVDYSFFIVASAGSKKIGVNQIALKSDGGDEVVSTLLSPRSGRVGDTSEFGSDVASFYDQEVETIASWAASHAQAPATLIIKGQQGDDITLQLSAAQLEALATLWRQASLYSRLRAAEQLYRNLEWQCVIARDQELNL